MSENKEQLTDVINHLINNNQQEAEAALHKVMTSKIRDRINTKNDGDSTEKEED